MRNCLIIDEMHPAIFTLLESAGIHYDYKPQITRNEVLSSISNYEGIIVRSKMKLDKDFLEKASHLKYIARAGSGKDGIDTEEAERRGIVTFNAPEGNRDAVAEHAIGLMLALLNNIVKSNAEVKNFIWKREANRGVELGHLTVGIIGYGNTGKAVSRRLAAFGCEVLAYDVKGIHSDESGIISSTLDEIYGKADLVSFHIPLNSRNMHFVDKKMIEAFSKPFWFINTSRGEIVNTQDLLAALHSGKILGAGLDVLENEKLASYSQEEKNQLEALAALEQVILTPHVAGWTHESYRKISEVLGAKLKAFYS